MKEGTNNYCEAGAQAKPTLCEAAGLDLMPSGSCRGLALLDIWDNNFLD